MSSCSSRPRISYSMRKSGNCTEPSRHGRSCSRAHASISRRSRSGRPSLSGRSRFRSCRNCWYSRLSSLFQDDSTDVGAAFPKPLFGAQVGAVERCVVLQLARVPDAAVEGLAPIVAAAPVIAFAAMGLQDSAASLGQGDRPLSFVDRDATNQPLFAQAADSLALVRRQVALGHDTKRAGGRQRACAFAVQLVLPVSVDDELPVAIPWQLEVMDERVTRVVSVVRIPVTIAVSWFTVTQVDVMGVRRLVVQADPPDVDLPWVAFVIARIDRSCVVQHRPLLPGDPAVTVFRM